MKVDGLVKKSFERKNVVRQLMIMAFVIVAAISLMAGKSNVFAAGSSEAKPIQLDSSVTGVLNKDGDTNTYSFSTPASGYFTIDFGPVSGPGDTRWDVRLYNSSYNLIHIEDYTEGFSSMKYSNYVGGTFYLVVKGKYSFEGISYNLKINYHADSHWENDNNDTEATANIIPANTDMNGILGYCSAGHDKDIYKFTVPSKKGYFNISFGCDNINTSGAYLCFTVLTSEGKEIFKKTTDETLTVNNLGFKPGSVIYLEVEHVSGSYFQPYKLRVDYNETDYFEVEDNDNQSRANVINFGSEYVGMIDGRRDETDYYSFSIAKDSKVTVEFGPKDISSTAYWNVSLYNTSAKENNIGSYIETRITKVLYLKKGTYYINVNGNSAGKWSPYTVKVTASPIAKVSTPKIKKVTIKNSYFYGYLNNIKMSKGLSGYVSYEVKVAAKKNMKKPLLSTTSAASKTIKSFKSNSINKKKSTYYVQVRPFVTDGFGGKIYVGAKSKVFKAKAKK